MVLGRPCCQVAGKCVDASCYFLEGLLWQKAVQELGPGRPMRPSRRRWMKFEDTLRRFSIAHTDEEWAKLVLERDDWMQYASAFADWATYTADSEAD